MGKRRKVVTSVYFKTSHYFHPKAPLKGSLAPLVEEAGTPHTLILGTQASDNALAEAKAFATNESAFWHIIGDALGFRRGFHIKRTDAVPTIKKHLLHPESAACDYEEAVARLLCAGFAVWDIVAQSERVGSLDCDIRNPCFNDVRALCSLYPSIHRICFATGGGSATIFRRAWKQWLATPGAFCVAPDRTSQAVFARCVSESGDSEAMCSGNDRDNERGGREAPIELMVMESVSPAAIPAVATRCPSKRAAAYALEGRLDLVTAGAPRASSYAWKRAQWLATAFPKNVLHPGAWAAVPFGSHLSDLEPWVEEENSDCDHATSVDSVRPKEANKRRADGAGRGGAGGKAAIKRRRPRSEEESESDTSSASAWSSETCSDSESSSAVE